MKNPQINALGPRALFGPLAALLLLTVPEARGQLIDGLLSYWNFEGDFNDSAGLHAGSASTVADDGTNAGGNVALTPGGPLGTYGDFARDFVEVANSDDVLAAGESLSISAWFRVDGFDQSWQALIGHGEGSDYRVARRGAEQTMGYAGGVTDIPDANVGPGINDGNWHHVVAITEAGLSTRLWLDGALVATGGVPALTNNGAARMMIGGNPDTGTDAAGAYRAWNGGIDDVAMWNRPLTATEIANIRNTGLGGQSLAVLLNIDDDDGDGLPNFWEDLHGLNRDDNGLDPNNNGLTGNPDHGADGDPDLDGSNNEDEYANQTDPRDADSDDDFSNDGAEALRLTDPLDPDSDDDGLLDGHETNNGAMSYVSPTDTGTDPQDPDTDADGVNDAVEIVEGTDPTDGADTPGPSTLPIEDDFEDGVFNTVDWTRNLGIPQGGAVVSETGGHLVLAGRGHLVTVGEFDPEVVGALSVSGEWTFVAVDGGDFIQILTRSDGLPAGEYGETNSGVEFFASGIDNSLNISARGTDFTVANVLKSGTVTLTQGSTYVFEAFDDGGGNLSFHVEERGNPANAGSVTAQLVSDLSVSNHIAIHNREGARTSHLESVSIKILEDSDEDGMPDDWEMLNMLVVGVKDGGLDPDIDGSTNLEEYLRDTDPQDEDTDDDGALDGHETKTGIFVDLTDRGTDPLDSDTDNDGLRDGIEDNTGVNAGPMNLGTNPLEADTDRDGIIDGYETNNGPDSYVGPTDTGTDPLNPDSDGDGAVDGSEVNRGYDPTDPGSVPPVSTLPIVDDFEDNALNSTDWETDISFAGAAISETGGHLLMTGRGYLNTVGEFDPEAVGGLSISGEWTFVQGDDFIQIMTRSDGVPVGQYGETNSGVEFFAFEGDETVTIRARNADHTVANVVQSGAIVLNIGTTYLFTIIDDGAGLLSFALEESGNPANGTVVTAELTGDVSASNKVVFHNREGAHASQLERVSITRLVEPGIRITDFAYDPLGGAGGNGAFSLTWTSVEGKLYGIYYSTDAIDWSADIDDGYPADPGDRTAFTFDAPLPEAPEFFLRVQEN